MNRRWAVGVVSAAVGSMVIIKAAGRRDLPVADGVSSAGKLPLDVASADRKFETATFGLG